MNRADRRRSDFRRPQASQQPSPAALVQAAGYGFGFALGLQALGNTPAPHGVPLAEWQRLGNEGRTAEARFRDGLRISNNLLDQVNTVTEATIDYDDLLTMCRDAADRGREGVAICESIERDLLAMQARATTEEDSA